MAKFSLGESAARQETLAAGRSPKATNALPGSAEKVEEMARRVARGESPTCPEDATLDDPYRRLEMRSCPGNFARVKTGRVVPVEQPDDHSQREHLAKEAKGRGVPGKNLRPPARGFARRLRELMRARGVSAKALALRGRISRRCVQMLTQGHYRPRLGVLLALAAVLDLTNDELASLVGYRQGARARA